MRLILVLSLGLLACAVFENQRHRRNLRKIPLRILVNGTRGKSSVVRLVAGILREAGYVTIAKTTGSDARIIGDDGSERPVSRPFGPRLTEQKSLARYAAERHADALVVECMAVRPESQMVMQRHLVRATIGVITNVRVDHVEEISRTLDETAEALALTIPQDGVLITTDPRFKEYGRRVAVVNGSSATPDILGRFSYPVFAENVSLALRVAEEIGIDREVALRGMLRAAPDIGVQRVCEIPFATFRVVIVNAFAANDVSSTLMAWEAAVERTDNDLPVVLLYNNREDREYRIAEFRTLLPKIPGIRLIATVGDYPGKTARAFSRLGADTLALKKGASCETVLTTLGGRIGEPFLLFCVGNFHGFGNELAMYCERFRSGEPVIG
ncbi:MAG: poly-gamma-glutamate synthase PgsB [Spirochaetae bacterium HGW-Spirochaetae-3]|nr:MAG: poly-gamma-glutamate synthase PgsB [Spirochaetae bacterium HGW-Spirochaetae-3]